MKYRNADTGEVIEWNGREWAVVEQAAPSVAPLPPAGFQRQPTDLERFGRGMVDIAQGGGQLLGHMAPELGAGWTAGMEAIGIPAGDDAGRKLYEEAAGPDLDWWRIGGQAAATAPLSGLNVVKGGGLAPTVINNAVQGGAAAALLPAESGGERIGNTLTGAAGGGVGGAAVYGLGKAGAAGVETGKRLWNQLSDMGRNRAATAVGLAAQQAGVPNLPAAVREAVEEEAARQLRATGEIDMAALQRKIDMEAIGLAGDLGPTRGQLSRSPTQWANEQNMAKLELDDGLNPLAERFRGQNEQLKAAGRGMVESTGQAEDAFAAGERAQRVAKMRSRLLQRGVSRKYDEARSLLAADEPIPTDQLRSDWAAVATEWEDRLPGPIKNRMAEFFADEAPRAFTPKEAEKTLQLINKRYGATNDKAERAALGAARDTILTTLEDYSQASSQEAVEAFQAARQAAAQRFSTLRPKYVAALLDDKIPVEDVVQRAVIGGETRELGKLVNFFGQGSARQQALGKQVLDGLRRQVDEHLYRKATGKAGETFSGTNYMAALDELGDRKLNLLFGESGALARRQLGRAAKAATTVPAGAPINYSNTAPTLVSYLSRIGSKVPLIGGGMDMLMGLAKLGKDYAAENAQRRAILEALQGTAVDSPEARAAMAALQRQIQSKLQLLGPGAAGGLLMSQ
jgi:hypothetical protein